MATVSVGSALGGGTGFEDDGLATRSEGQRAPRGQGRERRRHHGGPAPG